MGNYHSKKDIDKAIQNALDAGWHWEKNTCKNHIAGFLYCRVDSGNDRCKIRVSSTPKNPTNVAKDLYKAIRKCTHKKIY